jgi:hypothetical protein
VEAARSAREENRKIPQRRFLPFGEFYLFHSELAAVARHPSMRALTFSSIPRGKFLPLQPTLYFQLLFLAVLLLGPVNQIPLQSCINIKLNRAFYTQINSNNVYENSLKKQRSLATCGVSPHSGKEQSIS